MASLEPRSNNKVYIVLGLFGITIIIYEIFMLTPGIPKLYEIIIIPVGKGYDLATLLYMSGSAITAFSSFRVAKKYIGSAMFTKAYFCLGLGYSSWFVGDLLFFYDDYVQELPHLIIPLLPDGEKTFIVRPADFVYLGIYINMSLHLYLNTNWFEKNKLKIFKKKAETKFFLFGVPAIGAVIYFTQYGTINFESILGSLNAVGGAFTLGLVFWGARVFKASSLAPAWTLLLLGIFISTVGDFLYYQVEDFNEVFGIYSFSITCYLLMYMIMNYGLYKHMKIL